MPEKIIESKNRCIWMDAGVMLFKLCESDFDCLSCQFDWAMTASATRQIARRLLAGNPAAQTVPWENKMRQPFGEGRK